MDLYPEVLAAGGLIRFGSIGYRLLRFIDTVGLRASDRVVCLGRCMRDRLLARGVEHERISVVHVWGQDLVGTSVPRSDNRFRKLWGLQDRFVVMYSGNLGLGHDVATMERTIEELASDEAVRWVIVGGGKGREALQRRLSARPDAMRHVEFHPYQRIDELQELLQAADVHIASMLPGWEGLIVPSKCIGVMAASRPLLWIGPGESECARMIMDAGCGMCIEPGDWRALMRVLHELRNDPGLIGALGAAGERAAKGPLSRREACERWIQIVEWLGPKSSDSAGEIKR